MADGAIYLTPAELCARLRGTVTLKTLSNWRRGIGGPGPAFMRFGNRVLYPVAFVESWEAWCQAAPADKPT